MRNIGRLPYLPRGLGLPSQRNPAHNMPKGDGGGAMRKRPGRTPGAMLAICGCVLTTAFLASPAAVRAAAAGVALARAKAAGGTVKVTAAGAGQDRHADAARAERHRYDRAGL